MVVIEALGSATGYDGFSPPRRAR